MGEFCCRRPELSATLRAIAEEGPEVLYSGPLAESLARDVQVTRLLYSLSRSPTLLSFSLREVHKREDVRRRGQTTRK